MKWNCLAVSLAATLVVGCSKSSNTESPSAPPSLGSSIEPPTTIEAPPHLVGLSPIDGDEIRRDGSDRYRFLFSTDTDVGVDEYRVSVVNHTTGEATGYTVAKPIGITNAVETYTVERLLILQPGYDYRWAVFAHDEDGTQLNRSDYRFFKVRISADGAQSRFDQVMPVGNAFVHHAASAIDDVAHPPSLSIDGFVDGGSFWAADLGSAMTYDIGSIQSVGGLYLHMNDPRNVWVRIETSADGQQWLDAFDGLVATSNVSPLTDFELPGVTARYLRVTGFGSQTNGWTNVREARWRGVGDPVAGVPARQVSADAVPGAVTRLHDDPRFDRFNRYLAEGLALAHQCHTDDDFGALVDATGDQPAFITYHRNGNQRLYAVDWNHLESDSMEFAVQGALGVMAEACELKSSLTYWYSALSNEVAALEDLLDSIDDTE